MKAGPHRQTTIFQRCRSVPRLLRPSSPVVIQPCWIDSTLSSTWLWEVVSFLEGESTLISPHPLFLMNQTYVRSRCDPFWPKSVENRFFCKIVIFDRGSGSDNDLWSKRLFLRTMSSQCGKEIVQWRSCSSRTPLLTVFVVVAHQRRRH